MTQTDSDGIPTMGDEVESILRRFTCTCGQPQTPGVMHRYDAPCYVIEEKDMDTPNPQTGAQEATKATFLDRLKAEHWELDKKGMRLTQFIRGQLTVTEGETKFDKGPMFNELPARDQQLLSLQAKVMADYFSILTERIWRAEHPQLRDAADKAAEEKPDANT